jgi:hypothetical protein
MSTIQEYNAGAGALVKVLETFFSLENGKLAGTVVISRTSPKGHVVPVVKFLESNNGTQRLIKRLKAFGFPTPTIEKNEAFFVNVAKRREITSSVGKPSTEITAEDTSKIYNALVEWAKEKGYNNAIIAGNGFVRVQVPKTANLACNLLKIKFNSDYKFTCTCEDIFFEPRAKRQKIVLSPQAVVSFKDYIIRVITEIFQIAIFHSDEKDNTIIVAFESEKEVEDAHDFANLCSIDCERKGTTLIFPVSETYPSLEEIQKLFEKTPQQVVADSQEIKQISHSEFAKQVREYVKTAGYVLTGKAGATTSPKPYRYALSLHGDVEALVLKITKEKPEWEAKIVTPGSKYIHVSLIGAISSEVDSKKEKEEVKSEAVAPTTNTSGVMDISLPKKVYTLMDSLRREINAEKASRSHVKEATSVIIAIGKKFGITYDGNNTSPMTKEYSNGRSIFWKGSKEKIAASLECFKAFGYKVELKKVAMFFYSVFPVTGGVDQTVISKAVVAEKKQAPDKKETGIVTISLSLTEETLQQVLKALSDTDLLAEVNNRKLISTNSYSDEELVVEVLKRGPDFLPKVMATLYGHK